MDWRCLACQRGAHEDCDVLRCECAFAWDEEAQDIVLCPALEEDGWPGDSPAR